MQNLVCGAAKNKNKFAGAMQVRHAKNEWERKCYAWGGCRGAKPAQTRQFGVPALRQNRGLGHEKWAGGRPVRPKSREETPKEGI